MTVAYDPTTAWSLEDAARTDLVESTTEFRAAELAVHQYLVTTPLARYEHTEYQGLVSDRTVAAVMLAHAAERYLRISS